VTLAGLLALAVLPVGVLLAPGGVADTVPPARVIPATVSADPLPAPQIDGVVWSQAVASTTVYAGGRFTTARPAGAAPNTKTVKRANLLSFDIRTGKLSSWAPSVNGQITAVAVSPDAKRVYVAGSFTRVNGVPRYRIAAFDRATGALVKAFAPALNASVNALAVSSTAVYAGGDFTTASGVARSRLAAFLTTNGALTRWAPAADAGVMSMVIAPGGASVVVGGHFGTLAGRVAPGLGAVDARTGAGRAFAANRLIKDTGPDSGITSLTTDGKLVYGTGYAWAGDGNFEGTFAANPTTGAIVWVEDCHGDTYSAAAVGRVVYTVGHAHYCGNIGGFPESNPRTWQRAVAFTTAATGTVAKNTSGSYTDFGGQPAPRMLMWWPNLRAGTFTGQGQAAWSVVATPSYAVLGGEFTHVNGRPQQGLVRFAVRALAPNKQGPVVSGVGLDLQATPGAGAREVALTWRTSWDRDNELLTYVLTRDGGATPVTTRSFRSVFWRSSRFAVTDTGVPAGSHTYRVTVKDPLGNTVRSQDVAVTVP
jgi:hypothetical protein